MLELSFEILNAFFLPLDFSFEVRLLLQQLANLKREIQRKEERIQDLERQLQHTSRSKIISYIEDNPGAQTPEITQKVADTVPGRVASHLDALEGEVIEQRAGGYYPGESDE
jgi:predicted transcriptional regulator